MPQFSAPQLERQRDAAIEMIVILIQSREQSHPTSVAEAQGAVDRLTGNIPALEERWPEAVTVLQMVIDRLLKDTKTH